MGCQSHRGLLRIKTVKTARAIRTAPTTLSQISVLARVAVFCFPEVFLRNGGCPWGLGAIPTSSNIYFSSSSSSSSSSPALISALLGNHAATVLHRPWFSERVRPAYKLQGSTNFHSLPPRLQRRTTDAWHFYVGSGDWMQVLMSAYKHFTNWVIFLTTPSCRISI